MPDFRLSSIIEFCGGSEIRYFFGYFPAPSAVPETVAKEPSRLLPQNPTQQRHIAVQIGTAAFLGALGPSQPITNFVWAVCHFRLDFANIFSRTSHIAGQYCAPAAPVRSIFFFNFHILKYLSCGFLLGLFLPPLGQLFAGTDLFKKILEGSRFPYSRHLSTTF